MDNKDTVRLLKECDAGAKMAVASIDEVLEKVSDLDMKQLLISSKDHHEKLGNEIHSKLLDWGSEEKEPNPVAKGMSWLKTNMKMALDNNDATVADLITDGCNMGVKSLHKYLNQCPTADRSAKELCLNLADIEDQLGKDLRSYL